ncbi:MAG TPA: N-6 DNA methylase, partial [Thermoanaerobaculia bacterium]
MFALLTELGYPVEPVAIVAGEWRRAGIDIAWPDASTLYLASRGQALDCYVVAGFDLPERDAAQRFLRSLAAYNVLRKPALVAWSPSSMALYDLSSHRDLRRLDVDLRHPSLHAIDRLNLLAVNGSGDHGRLFDRALDRETLARQFFERFRGAVREVDGSLRGQFARERADATAAEALLVLSRLLFLYFIQQKGWLNGERRFLVDRLDAALQSGHLFYESVLAPLFFGCLNTPVRDRDLPPRLLGRVPYLNGGLFEPSPFEKKHPNIAIANELMQHIIENVFERFAFCIDESDSAGTHIDPEMLGKVFESLMAEDERASTGSFYTPKPIVDALTDRAIDEWCGRDTGAKLLQRLESIAVLDPACGSGAFLLSALQAIEKRIAANGGTPDRQAIVERSLFGVDLKPEAVRLCELRLWLAIVSQRDGAVDSIPPLPNLDRNILQGNSLLSPIDFLGDGRGDV